MSLTSTALMFIPVTSWKVPHDQPTKRENPGLVHKWVSSICWSKLEMDCCHTTAPLASYLGRQWDGKSSK